MKRCKILIVDDIPTNVTLISTIIKKKLDAYSDTALSGEEALKKIESFNPDIIILDLMRMGRDTQREEQTWQRRGGDNRDIGNNRRGEHGGML